MRPCKMTKNCETPGEPWELIGRSAKLRFPQKNYWWQSAQWLELINLPFVEGLIVALHEVLVWFWSIQFLVVLPTGVQGAEEWLLLRRRCLREYSLPCLSAEVPKVSSCVNLSLACAIIASSSSWTFPVWDDGSCNVPVGLSTCWSFPAASVNESVK